MFFSIMQHNAGRLTEAVGLPTATLVLCSVIVKPNLRNSDHSCKIKGQTFIIL